jgi:hypothetical protein
MSDFLTRRDALRQLGAAGAAAAGVAAVPEVARTITHAAAEITVAGQPAEISVASISATTVRITIHPVIDGRPAPVADTGALT